MKKELTIAKINLLWPKVPLFMTLVVCLVQFLSIYIQYLINADGATSISIGNISFLYLFVSAVFAPIYSFSRIMHLNGKKKDFFIGSYISYIILAATLSVINTVLYLTIDKVFSARIEIYNLIEVFGWIESGMIIATFRIFAFAVLISVILHTLTALQTSKVGWITDIVIIAIPAVFIPITQLRNVLVTVISWFTFTDKGIFQIALCLFSSVVIYSANLLVLRKKHI